MANGIIPSMANITMIYGKWYKLYDAVHDASKNHTTKNYPIKYDKSQCW